MVHNSCLVGYGVLRPTFCGIYAGLRPKFPTLPKVLLKYVSKTTEPVENPYMSFSAPPLLTPAQVKVLVSATREARLEALFVLVLHTGLR